MKKLLLMTIVVCIGLSMGCKKENASKEIIYEKIRGLEISKFGNTLIVYYGGSNTYDLTFKKDGTYTKKKWSDKSKVSGTWNASGNEITMSETNGPTYTLAANPEGIVKDGMATYINGEAGGISGLFNEMVGTGSGVVDMCWLSATGKYKVELLGDVGTIVLNFHDANQVNINRQTSSGAFIEDNEYEYTGCSGNVLFTKIGTTGTPQDITKIQETWWVEGTPINLFFISDNSYVGYMVTNIDYLGKY